MKRYVSLACFTMVLVMCLVSPVSAADLSTDYIDLLDFNDINTNQFSEGNFFYFNGSHTISLDFPFRTTCYGVDLIFTCTGSVPSSIYAYVGGVDVNLTLVPIGDSLYRAYGYTYGNAANSLSLDFYNNSTGTSYITVHSCLIRSTHTTNFDSDCYCGISAIDYDKTIHFISTDEINYRTFVGTEDIYNMGYQLYLYNLNWKKYDYIDYMLYTVVDSISSISCTFGGLNVPFEVSYISNDPSISSDFIYSIRVDCRSLDRSIDDYPMVTVSGNVITGSANMISVVSCNGVVVDSVDLTNSLINRLINTIKDQFLILSNKLDLNHSGTLQEFRDQFTNLHTWFDLQTSQIKQEFRDQFSNLYLWINNQTVILESAIRGDTSPGNSFQQQVNQKDQQLNNMAAVMESVDQPDINSVNVSANTYVDGTVLAASMSGITSVFSQGLFFDLIVMSIMMATAGYVLFGKR